MRFLECSSGQPLGMESGTIKGPELTASSFTHLKGARNARLNDPLSAWRAKADDTTPWIQVDLKVITTVNQIITQGKTIETLTGYVKTFEVSYGYMENNLIIHKVNGTVQVF